MGRRRRRTVGTTFVRRGAASLGSATGGAPRKPHAHGPCLLPGRRRCEKGGGGAVAPTARTHPPRERLDASVPLCRGAPSYRVKYRVVSVPALRPASKKATGRAATCRLDPRTSRAGQTVVPQYSGKTYAIGLYMSGQTPGCSSVAESCILGQGRANASSNWRPSDYPLLPKTIW